MKGEWAAGELNNYAGGEEDCATIHRELQGWNDLTCCYWAQCVCNTDLPKWQELDLCQATCRMEHADQEAMCSDEQCTGCKECGNIAAQNHKDLGCKEMVSEVGGVSTIRALIMMLTVALIL